jgi:hypothetical protein
MESVFCPAAIFHGSVALPFVIPSEAEGSAVLRTLTGNVFAKKNRSWQKPTPATVVCFIGMGI